MENRSIYLCEDTLDGLFTAIYTAWSDERGFGCVEIRPGAQAEPELFCDYREVTTDEEKAVKVNRSIKKKLGPEAYEEICYAAASCDPEKGTAIFHTLVEGLAGGRSNPYVMENLSNPYIRKVAKLQLTVWHEMHRFLGFVRFRELRGSVLFARIHPENDVLTLIAPHFANRFPNENWIIYDENRDMALLHEQGKGWVVRRELHLDPDQIRKMEGEDETFENLWKGFVSSIAIKERKNPNLQRQNMPLKFRDCITEFQG